MELVYSILCVLGSSVYLAYLFMRKNPDSDFWDKSMRIRGVLGGIGLFFIGIGMLLEYLLK